LLLLPLDLRQKHGVPVLGTVDVPRPQLHRQTVALSIEQQQRVIAGRLEVAVVGALLLLAVDGDLGRRACYGSYETMVCQRLCVKTPGATNIEDAGDLELVPPAKLLSWPEEF
jgi:hypothetical protein